MNSRKIEDRTTKKVEKETEKWEQNNSSKGKRKQIMGEAMNSGSHKERKLYNYHVLHAIIFLEKALNIKKVLY